MDDEEYEDEFGASYEATADEVISEAIDLLFKSDQDQAAGILAKWYWGVDPDEEDE